MKTMNGSEYVQKIVQTLGQQVRRLEGSRPAAAETLVSTGSEALDWLLPGGGLSRGTLVEWLAGAAGGGAGSLALAAAGAACRDGGALVVMDRRRTFYPPAAAALGIDLQRMIVIRTESDADEYWALDQALRCGGVAAVLCQPEKLDGRAYRRMQLAVESSGCLGMLVRPAAVRGEPSWAQTRWLVEPLASAGGRRLRVRLLRSRPMLGQRAVELEIDDETGITAAHALPLAAELADPAAHCRPAGA